MKQEILLKINGDEQELFIHTNRTLLDVLRNDLHLTAAKEGCGLGECGTCTVLMEGVPVKSCLVLAAEAEGKEILTAEGLARGSKLHPVQKVFIENHAFQCGFCTPAMILTARALLEKNPDPTEEEARRTISGNICRCTGYEDIVSAIMSASKEMKRTNDGNKDE
jgi:carbon-monoxide dehydrogenase small subunit